jgi:hypothetical protein
LTEDDISQKSKTNESLQPGFTDTVANKFYFPHLTPDLMVKYIHDIKSNAAGSDGINGQTLKIILPVIFPVLLDIYDCSLNYSTFPLAWKSAIVKPIEKIRNPTESCHFRPISLLCNISKPLERFVHRSTFDFLSSNNLLDKFQSGFRKGHSTQTALVRVTEDIRFSIDNKKVTVLVFFDFSKAFDCVNHDLLLLKMYKLGFSTSVIQWFKSYLSFRTQAVKGNGDDISSFANVTCGVPQGSILGPLLFNLFIKDLPGSIFHSKYQLYADDLQIYIHCYPKFLHDAVEKVNEDVVRICTWAKENFLKINASKTKSIIIGTSQFVNKLNYNVLPKICVDGTELKYSTSVVDLGISINNTLTWNDYVSQVSNRWHKTLAQLKYFKQLMPLDIRKKLVTTLLIPHIDYCMLVISDPTQEVLNKLQMLINNCVRYIYNVPFNEHVTPYYHKLNWLKLRERRRLKFGLFMYKILTENVPDYLHDAIIIHASRPERCFRVLRRFKLPKCRTNTYQSSSLNLAMREWNDIPDYIVNSENIHCFRRSMFTYLFNNFYSKFHF